MEPLKRAGALSPLRPLRIIGGNLALDLANTIDGPDPYVYDHLSDPARLLAWSRERGLITDPEHDDAQAVTAKHPDRAAKSLAATHGLRTAIQDGFTALTENQPFPPNAWRTLRGQIAEAVSHAELSSNPPGLSWSDTPLDRAAYAGAHAALQLLASRELQRLKRCTGCEWLFLDQSKNNSRRWCSMDICGTSQKIRRYVERRAVARQQRPADSRATDRW